LDEQTVLVIDMDKTTVGARGRNDTVVDEARLEGVRLTVEGLLGKDFNEDAFRRVYAELNRPQYHPFTADNQDYLAYICLALGGGLYGLEALVADVRQGRMVTFEQFIAWVEARKEQLSPDLRSIHTEIYSNVQVGDPTPFKAFRRNEYRATIGRFGVLSDDAPLERMLVEEILVTQEVRAQAQVWLARGALLLGLSDKPDEAALPPPELAAQGWLPLHRAITHAVGA
jgi:hypothetical protein